MGSGMRRKTTKFGEREPQRLLGISACRVIADATARPIKKGSIVALAAATSGVHALSKGCLSPPKGQQQRHLKQQQEHLRVSPGSPSPSSHLVSNTFEAAVATEWFAPRPSRLLLGAALVAGCTPALAWLIYLWLLPALGGCVLLPLYLLDCWPAAVGPAAGLLSSFVVAPLQPWLKIWRYLMGYRTGYVTPKTTRKGIAALEVLELQRAGGVGFRAFDLLEHLPSNHVVRLRGNDASKPVVLYLHGGPGASEMIAGADGGFRELLHSEFVVADYDQRSAMSSGALNDVQSEAFLATLTIEQHVLDAIAIGEWLHREPRLLAARGMAPLRLHLMGGSWGSMLALLVAQRRPDLFSGPVIVRGLCVDIRRSEELSLRYLLDTMARAGASAASIEAVKRVGGFRPDARDLLVQRTWLQSYGGMSYNEYVRAQQGEPAGRMDLFFRNALAMATTPEIGLKACLEAMPLLRTSLARLWGQMAAQDMRVELVGLNLVVAQGKYDHCTASALVKPWLTDSLSLSTGGEATLVWFEGSGHSPEKEEPRRFAELVFQHWLEGAGDSASGMIAAPAATPTSPPAVHTHKQWNQGRASF